MTRNLAPVGKAPAWLQTPLSKTSLDSQSFDKHRAMIGFELEVLSKKVDRFGWDRDRGSAAQDRLMVDWMDALCDFTLAEVKAACRQAVLDNPNKCPNEGHVRKLILSARQRDLQAYAPKPVEDDLKPFQPISEERRREIMREAGFEVEK